MKETELLEGKSPNKQGFMLQIMFQLGSDDLLVHLGCIQIHLVTGMYPKLWLVIDPIHLHSLGNWARECIWDVSQLKKKRKLKKRPPIFEGSLMDP